MTLPAPALDEAKDHATRSWYRFMDVRGLKARIPSWQTRTAPDGAPVLSAEVTGQGVAHALRLFASDCHLALAYPGDLRPQFDIDSPDRTVLVWRYRGVWVELWHPDTAPAAPTPVQATPEVDTALVSAASRRPLLGPGGRLTFTRNRRKTTQSA
ncbi:hypothetical protein ABZX39_33130 [Streptomyces collinus]|uniref:hypothetical protein n=1 Tax=Streptomyces collinus TaxID=42684 RepID=UPI0033AA4D09